MDRYVKVVLTVIAVALVVIAFRLSVPGAHAQVGSACGRSSSDPCYVTVGREFVNVQVTNWPSSLGR
jgi:hypothetical protein